MTEFICRVCVCVYICAQNSSSSYSGELQVLEHLDREEQDEYRFKMHAVDGGGRYCEADIHITVEDFNDNIPQFSTDAYTFTVFENTEIGTYVAKLLASDADTGEFTIFLWLHTQYNVNIYQSRQLCSVCALRKKQKNHHN